MLFRIQSGNQFHFNNGTEVDTIERAEAIAQEYASHMSCKDANAWVQIGQLVPQGIDIVLRRFVGGGVDGWGEAKVPKLDAPTGLPLTNAHTQQPDLRAAQSLAAGEITPGQRAETETQPIDSGEAQRADMQERTAVAVKSNGSPLPLQIAEN